MTVKWYGDKLLQQIREGTPDALWAGAELLRDAAVKRAPKKSGNLAESAYIGIEGRSTYRTDKRFNKEVKAPKGGAVVGFAAFYARFIEYGTSKLPARAYFRPALDELKGKIGETIVRKIGSKIK